MKLRAWNHKAGKGPPHFKSLVAPPYYAAPLHALSRALSLFLEMRSRSRRFLSFPKIE